MIKEDVIIYDDYLTKSYHTALLNFVFKPSFKWTYHSNISSQNKENMEHYGFSHNILDANMKVWFSEHSDMLKPLIWQMRDTADCDEVMRARFDMTLFNKNNLMHEPHIDFVNDTNVSSIYYLNDTDGDTIIFNEKELHGKYTIKHRIPPKANRLVLFKGEFVHTGCSPSKNANRVLINSNYCNREG